MAIAFSLTPGDFAAGVRLGILRTEGEIAPGVQITIHRTVGVQPDVQHIAFKRYAGEAAAPTFAVGSVFAGAGVMAPLTALGHGGDVFAGSGVMAPLTALGHGAGAGSATLLPLVATGYGPGRGAGTLLPLFALGGGPPGGAATLQALTASGTGQERISSGVIVLLPLTGVGVGHPANGGAGILESLTAAGAGGTVPVFVGDWMLQLFSGVGSFLSESKYTGNFRLPQFQKTGTLLNGAAFSGNFQLPLFQNSGTLLNGSGFVGNFKLTMWQNAAALLNGSAFSGNFKLPLFRHAGTLLIENAFVGSFKLPMFQASGQALPGTAFTASWTLPLFSKSGQFGTYQYTGAWVLPMFGMSGQVVSEIGDTYRAWPINLKNMALTQYDNFLFNSITRFNGEYLAAGSGGLMALTGADDAGTKIDARIRFGEHDFGIESLKRIEEIFATYRSAGDLTMRVIIDGGDTYEYTLLATGNTGMATNRAKIGKAIRSNFYTLEIANIDGVKFDLQNITLHPVVLSRKIGRPPVTRVFTGRMQLPSVTNIGQF